MTNIFRALSTVSVLTCALGFSLAQAQSLSEAPKGEDRKLFTHPPVSPSEFKYEIVFEEFHRRPFCDVTHTWENQEVRTETDYDSPRYSEYTHTVRHEDYNAKEKRERIYDTKLCFPDGAIVRDKDGDRIRVSKFYDSGIEDRDRRSSDRATNTQAACQIKQIAAFEEAMKTKVNWDVMRVLFGALTVEFVVGDNSDKSFADKDLTYGYYCRDYRSTEAYIGAVIDSNGNCKTATAKELAMQMHNCAKATFSPSSLEALEGDKGNSRKQARATGRDIPSDVTLAGTPANASQNMHAPGAR